MGIQTLIHYPVPPHQQPAYQEWRTKQLPLTERIHQQVLSLPMGPMMTAQDAMVVVDVCNQWSG
jgi:dTDP-4-amino-4,6-dideoxygalactose transaminase